jgi:hypothetical protein
MAFAVWYHLARLLDAAQHAPRDVPSDQTIHGPFVEVLQLIELPGRTREARNHQDSGFRIHGVFRPYRKANDVSDERYCVQPAEIAQLHKT